MGNIHTIFEGFFFSQRKSAERNSDCGKPMPVSVKREEMPRQHPTSEFRRSRSSPAFYTFEDLGVNSCAPAEESTKPDIKIPMVSNDSVPIVTWEEAEEKLLWDEYTRQHSSIRSIASEELLDLGMSDPHQKDVRIELEDEDVVVLYESKRPRATCIDNADAAFGSEKIEGGPGMSSKLNKKKKRTRWDTVLRFFHIVGSSGKLGVK